MSIQKKDEIYRKWIQVSIYVMDFPGLIHLSDGFLFEREDCIGICV